MEKRDKKYILSKQVGLKLFLVLILTGLIVFSIFFFIQNKKDEEFQKNRQGEMKVIEEYIKYKEDIKNDNLE